MYRPRWVHRALYSNTNNNNSSTHTHTHKRVDKHGCKKGSLKTVSRCVLRAALKEEAQPGWRQRKETIFHQIFLCLHEG